MEGHLDTISVSLKDENYFEFSNGLWTGKKGPFIKAKVIRNTNFTLLGNINTDNIAEIEVEEKQFASRKLLDGDIIIERSGGGPKQPVGRVVYFNLPGNDNFSFSNFTSLIRSKNHDVIRSRFLFFTLLNFYYNADIQRYQAQTTGLRNLDFNKYQQSAIIKVLPIKEQDEIIKILDLILSSIHKQEELLITTSELKNALMKKLFSKGLNNEVLKETDIGLLPESWDVVELYHLITQIDYGTSVKCSYEYSTQLPVLRIPNIINGNIDISDLKYGKLTPKEMDRLILSFGDLLFVRTNGVKENAGRCAIFKDEIKQCYYASYLIRVKLQKEILLPSFFSLYARTETGQKFLSGRASRTADGKFNINTGTIKAVHVPIPDIKEQEQIVFAIEAVDNKIQHHQKRKQSLKCLFNAVLYQLMTGKIQTSEIAQQIIDGELLRV